MENEFITTRKNIYRDEALGDLIYHDQCSTTVERTEDRIIIKVLLEKEQNWLQLADQLFASVAVMSNWVWDRICQDHVEYFSELPALKRDEWEEEQRMKALFTPTDPWNYLYFHSTSNWVIYENDMDYLFLYEMEIKDSYPLGIDHQLDALHFWPQDDLGMVTIFLRSWHDRVNGYRPDPEEEAESCDRS